MECSVETSCRMSSFAKSLKSGSGEIGCFVPG